MKIVFDKVMPQPLNSIQHGTKSIWGNKMEVAKGEKILLNASSGKGKSTFTFTALGLRSDYAGEVFYDNININTSNQMIGHRYVKKRYQWFFKTCNYSLS